MTGIGRAMSNSKRLSFVPCLVKNKVGQRAKFTFEGYTGTVYWRRTMNSTVSCSKHVCRLYPVCPKSMYPFVHLAFTSHDASCSFRIPLAGTRHVPRHIPELSSKPRKPDDGISSQFNDTYEFAK